MQRNVLKGFLAIFGAKGLTLLLTVLITPVLVRLLGSSQYGDYAFIISLLGMTMIITNAGVFDGIRKYIAEDRAYPNWTEQVFGFYCRVAFVLALVVAILFATISGTEFVNEFLKQDVSTYFFLLGVLIIGRQAYSVARGGLMGLGFEDRSEPLRVLQKVLFGVFGLSLCYLEFGVTGVLVGHIVASFSVSAIAFILLSREINLKAVFNSAPPRFPKRDLLSFNSLSIVLILLTASLYHVDIILLRLIVGSEATGHYRAALLVTEFLWFVPMTLQTVLLHSSSELWAKNRTEQITELVSRITRYNLLLVVLLAIGLASLADDFIPLYFGPEFESSVLPLLILLPGVVGFALSRPIFAVGQGKGDIPVLIVATAAASILNFCLNFLLIPRYETIGAAVSTSIGYGSMVVFHSLAARRIGFNPFADLRVGRVLVTTLVASPIIFALAYVIESSIYSLLIVPPIGFVTYSTLALRIQAITPDELIPLLDEIPAPFSEWSIKTVRFLG